MKLRAGRTRAGIVGLLLLSIALLAACGRKASEPTSSTPAASPSAKPASQQTAFERDLDYVRTGQFAYVLVFSRKDGAEFSNDDIVYLKANSPPETNQWVKTDEGKRVIAGTNFEFKQEQLDALGKRFGIENLSGK
jgi:hypothetical protein